MSESSSLMRASQNGHLQIVNRLFKILVLIHQLSTNSSIILAAEYNHTDVFNRLFEDPRVIPIDQHCFN